MRWREFRRSDNVEDRRGMPMGGAGLKLGGGGLLLVLLISVITGTNPLDLLGSLEEASPPAVDQGPERKPPQDDPQADFIRAVLGGREGPQADIVALNAGAALYLGGHDSTLHAGVLAARELILGGEGLRRLDAFVEFTRSEEAA